MSNADKHDEVAFYEIRVQGLLDESWSAWLAGLAVRPLASGETLLTGYIRDQSALHGVLGKIRDLGLPLLGVERKGKPGGSKSAGK